MGAHRKPGTRSLSAICLLAIISFCLGLAACSSGKQPEKAVETQPPAEKTQRFDLKGKVVSVNPAQKELVVDHEAIPNFMAAMTMPYTVKDEKLMEGVGAGDQITAQVVAGDHGVWLENVVVTGKAAPAAAAPKGK